LANAAGGELVKFPDDTKREFFVATDLDTYTFDTYDDLRATYKYKILAFEGTTDRTKAEKEFNLIIDGCLVVTALPSPTFSYTIYGPTT